MRKRMLFLLKIQNFFFGPNLNRLTNYQNKKWNLKNLVLLLFSIYGKMIWCKKTWDIAKIVQNCRVFWASLTKPIKKKMFIRCFSVSNVYQYQKLTSSLTFFLMYCKDFANFLFGYFQHDWPYPPKLIASTCRKVWCLSACKKSTLSLLYFLRYCKDLVKLLFWVVWACLAMTTKNDNMSLQKMLMFTSCKILTFYSKYR